MYKLLGMLVALAMFCAMPALAFAQEEVEQDVEQENETEQEADASGGGGGEDGSGGSGGFAGNQNATCQQVAGGDAECSIDQSQNFGGDRFVGGGDFDNGEGHGHGGGVSVGRVTGGVGGGGVGGVTLARTGFDAWVLALIGGLSLAGGLGLLAAQRRGRLDA